MLELEPSEYEYVAGYLEATGSYLVLRRVPRLPPMPSSVGGLRRGIFLDVETTGLDPARDEIIQLAMVPFAYDAEGRIHGAGEAFCKLREPSVEIPERVTKLTDIHSMDVYGCSIHPAEIVAFAGSPDIVVAHNAAFDRRFVERFCPAFMPLSAWTRRSRQLTPIRDFRTGGDRGPHVEVTETHILSARQCLRD